MRCQQNACDVRTDARTYNDPYLRVLQWKLLLEDAAGDIPYQSEYNRMIKKDADYVRRVVGSGEISGPVLELGAGYGGETCREIVADAGMAYFCTDVTAGPGVDFAADFEVDDIRQHIPRADFGCVLILNVLEHVFEPVKVLDNALSLVRAGGHVVTVTPCQWPVHSYPVDCQRLLGDWYVRFAERRDGILLIERYFEYVGYGSVSAYASGSTKSLPPPSSSTAKSVYSRALHRLFGTHGRGQWSANYIAIGAVFQKC